MNAIKAINFGELLQVIILLTLCGCFTTLFSSKLTIVAILVGIFFSLTLMVTSIFTAVVSYRWVVNYIKLKEGKNG